MWRNWKREGECLVAFTKNLEVKCSINLAEVEGILMEAAHLWYSIKTRELWQVWPIHFWNVYSAKTHPETCQQSQNLWKLAKTRINSPKTQQNMPNTVIVSFSPQNFFCFEIFNAHVLQSWKPSFSKPQAGQVFFTTLGISRAVRQGLKTLEVKGDSQLIIN